MKQWVVWCKHADGWHIEYQGSEPEAQQRAQRLMDANSNVRLLPRHKNSLADLLE